MLDDVLSAVKAGDRKILAAAPQASPGVLAALAAAMPDLEDEQRALAVSFVARSGVAGAGAILLEATDDPDLMVGSSAALALASCADPPPLAAVLAAIPARPPELRGALYRVAGLATEPGALLRARKVAERETSPEAAAEAIVALARLGGDEERALFVEALKNAEPDQAMRLREQLLYIGVPSFARGMLPWLDDARPVVRLCFDTPGGPPMARMRDIAVWTAAATGIQIDPAPGRLREYPPDIVEAARRALESLPELPPIRSSPP